MLSHGDARSYLSEGRGNKAGLTKMETERPNIAPCYSIYFLSSHLDFWRVISEIIKHRTLYAIAKF